MDEKELSELTHKMVEELKTLKKVLEERGEWKEKQRAVRHKRSREWPWSRHILPAATNCAFSTW